ncbi:hypothetical protein BM1_03948 [Bipolaris maydis]|nr:hypothetical protein BM1_03948 [Bipolaris maydis]
MLLQVACMEIGSTALGLAQMVLNGGLRSLETLPEIMLLGFLGMRSFGSGRERVDPRSSEFNPRPH